MRVVDQRNEVGGVVMAAGGEVIELSCPAKINLALSVGGRTDSGLHPIASWMVGLEFADSLRLQRLESGPSRFELLPAEAAGPAIVMDWPIEKDLTYRAHGLMEACVGRALPIHLTLHKRIPAQAGLGGGSSDAACTLVGLNRLFSLGLSHDKLLELAGQLGSDVGFLVQCVEGSSWALATGFGQRLENLTPRGEIRGAIHVVLIFPGFGCPTGPVYQAFDSLFPDPAREADISRVRALASSWPIAADGLFNDLTEPACMVRPALREVIDHVRHALRVSEVGVAEDTPGIRSPGVTRVIPGPLPGVTGSGSTLFVIAPDQATAEEWAHRITASTKLATVATRSL